MKMNKRVFKAKMFAECLALVSCFSFLAANVYASNSNNANTAGNQKLETAVESVPQSKVIKCTVVNAATGEPVPGAVVTVVGSNKYASTDADGKFVLDNGGKAIKIECLGYKTLEVASPVNGMVIRVTAEAVKLDDVVVVGYGTQRKVTLTGSVTSTKGEIVEKSSPVNLSQGLAGRLSGVIVNNRSGEPGADGTTIFIRGRSSLGDNSPLIIIDGIAGRENLDRLNAEDIESITVLKDASAAIYGSRSANGVILVTTKRGKVDEKPTVTFSYDLGIQQATRMLDMCDANQYVDAYNQVNSDKGVGAAFSPDEVEAYRIGSNRVLYPNTDWFKELIKSASYQHKFGVTVSGGTKTMNYFVSANGQMQDGIYHKSATNYNLAGFRANLDVKVAKNLKAGFDISGRQQHKNYSAYTSDDYGVFYIAARRTPTSTAYYPNGLLQSGGSNPVAMVQDITGYNKYTLDRLNTTLSLRLDMPFVTKGLWAEARAAYDKTSTFRKLWYKSWTGYNFNEETEKYDAIQSGVANPQLYQYYTTNHQLTINATLNYDRYFFEDHHVSAMIGVEQNKYHQDYFTAANLNFDSDAIDQMFAGNSDSQYYKINGNAAETARRSFFGRLNYDYKGKYMVSGIFRYDGSQNFPDGKRWGFFPGVSAGWRISEEPFIKDNFHWINNLKLRASYGEVGNDNIAAFQYLATYEVNSSYHQVFGQTNVTGIYPGTIPNTSVTWERAKSWNFGLDGTLWNGLLGFEIEYFRTKRSDILCTRQGTVPNYTGMTSSS